jgi:hypothetical protein
MRTIIRNQAEALGYEITEWDIEQIIDSVYIHLMHRKGNVYLPGVRQAIRAYFS